MKFNAARSYSFLDTLTAPGEVRLLLFWNPGNDWFPNVFPLFYGNHSFSLSQLLPPQRRPEPFCAQAAWTLRKPMISNGFQRFLWGARGRMFFLTRKRQAANGRKRCFSKDFQRFRETVVVMFFWHAMFFLTCSESLVLPTFLYGFRGPQGVMFFWHVQSTRSVKRKLFSCYM